MITGGSKITGLTGAAPIYSARTSASKTERTRGASAAARFDSITLSGERQGSFAMQLTGELTQEVRASVTPGRLSSLSQQIASGEYQPDPMSIARRMLLLPEDA